MGGDWIGSGSLFSNLESSVGMRSTCEYTRAVGRWVVIEQGVGGLFSSLEVINGIEYTN